MSELMNENTPPELVGTAAFVCGVVTTDDYNPCLRISPETWADLVAVYKTTVNVELITYADDGTELLFFKNSNSVMGVYKAGEPFAKIWFKGT